ncbi:MarR family transcriptional regulator [Paenibacillus sp. FSL H7-0716]|uniref:MarR family transcriptional regulator n=1 Tax=Paenibacillus odorifer TaxID=189426 RepID=A0A1R0YXJ1_9BACL|nr:MarR family transcriptional regulator [Paenibacillus odorifer]AWV33600.1 MarR family transcriptional regulator [Paenibacillus odorifer]OME12622.1 MarR family transcriptional regulator [Paenibacillus odorifer]OME20139.1 MarR family transcriptional regulator [Paenibacillus odorifer]
MDHLQQFVLNQPLHTKAFFTLVEATANLVSVSEKYWQSKGLNGARIRILVEISKHGGAILPSTLAQIIGVTKANISMLLTPLERDGLITRSNDTKDGRKSVISITSEGQQLLLEHLPENRQAVAERMQNLNDQELHQLIFLLQKLSTFE